MAYQSTSVMETLEKINSSYFLPSLQRPYVWGTKDIELLFDSLMRKYPISSFLIWDVKPGDIDGLNVYKFIEDYAVDTSMNASANIGNQRVSLVLDGQQRLTSLLIGLKGSFTKNVGKKVKQQYLYMDLLRMPMNEKFGGDRGYAFKFMEPDDVVSSKEQQWFRVSHMNTCRSREGLDRLANEVCSDSSAAFQLFPDQINVINQNLTGLWEALWKTDNIAYYTEKGTNHERVLEIFIRANSAGEKLSKSALMFSAIVTSWGESNIKDDINRFLKENGGKGSGGRNSKWLDSDWLMKACLVISNLPVVYKLGSFNQVNIAKIKANWPMIKESIKELVKVLNNAGVDGTNLTAKNSLMPIVYYIAHTGLKANSSEEWHVQNRDRIRSWLLKVLLARSFGAASDGKIIAGRKVIAECAAANDRDFPEFKLLEKINSHDKINLRDPRAIDEILNTEYKSGKYCFFALSLIYPDTDFSQESFHIDHIFPTSRFSRAKLAAAGVDASRFAAYENCQNRLANLCLLTEDENLSKSNKEVATWLSKQGSSYSERHLIPTEIPYLDTSQFLDFYNERYQLLRSRLNTVLGFNSPEDGEGRHAEEKPLSESRSVEALIISESINDMYLGWAPRVQDALNLLESSLSVSWPSADIYPSLNKITEDLSVGVCRPDATPLIAARCLGLKFTDIALIIQLSAELSRHADTFLRDRNLAFQYEVDEILECVTIVVDSSIGQLYGRQIGELLEYLTPFIPADIRELGAGRRPDAY